MKKIQFIMLFFDIFLVIMATQVQAIQANVGFVGQKEVETGKEYTLNVKVSNDVAIGVIQGVLSYDNNIQNVTINASYNGWTTTYNTENGIFNSFNAVGTKEGEILQITYKLKDGANTGIITISNIELTTIDYNTINLDNKEIFSVNTKTKQQEVNDQEDHVEKNIVSENIVTPVEQVEKKDNSTKEENNINTQSTSVNEKEKKSADTVKSEVSNTAKQNLPRTGKTAITIFFVIVVFGIVAILFYKKNANIDI